MALDQDLCYGALRSKDARFDGRFFVGVSSTGVYCRPVCRAKLPKRENCAFFASAAEAEAAGYRPCLQCRPELAPGMAPVDSERTLAARAARLLREGCGSPIDLEAFAGRLGYTSRHLRRAFSEAFGVTPGQYLQTCRLLMAKHLLASTDLPVARIADVVGFGSVRQFNAVFKERYGLVPSAVRHGRKGRPVEGSVTLELDYRPPFAWERLLGFLEMRAIPGVEAVRDGAYHRSAQLADPSTGEVVRGWLSVRPDASRARAIVTVSSSLVGVLPQVVARVRRQFDLDCNPEAIAAGLEGFCERFPGAYLSGTRLPGCFDEFEMCVRAILGQQISVKGASTLAGRVATRLGVPVEAPEEGVTCTFPSAREVCALGEEAQEALGSLGIVGARVRTIRQLAQGLADGSLDLSYGADPQVTVPALQAIPGIGPWTAQYLSMRATGDPDAFPSTDLGVRKAFESLAQGQVEAIAEGWRPWRSYATISLWSH